MSISLKPNADGSAAILVGGVERLKINADGGINDGAPIFSAYQTESTNPVAHATWTKVLVSTEEFDSHGCLASSKFTPTVAGYYRISAGAGIQTIAASSVYILSLWKNGSEFKRIKQDVVTIAGGVYPNGSALIYMNGTTDYLELYTYQSSGSEVSIHGGHPATTYFQGELIKGA